MVPASALELAQTGSYVYVVKPDGTAEPRPVEVGQRQGEEVVIAKGVSEGEKVVTMGQMLVIPGKPVTIVPSPETAAAGAIPAVDQTAGTAAPTTMTAGVAPTTAPAGS
jgi:hypothetical protein